METHEIFKGKIHIYRRDQKGGGRQGPEIARKDLYEYAGQQNKL